MILSIIAALDENGGIGRGEVLPWRLPADLKYFKRLTRGHHVIMGRKTYESIGRPLPERVMLVVSRQVGYAAAGCQVLNSLEAACNAARLAGENEAFVIGGGEIYARALPLAERLYLTRVHASLAVDTYFPSIGWDDWELVSAEEHPADESHAFAFCFEIYQHRGFRPQPI